MTRNPTDDQATSREAADAATGLVAAAREAGRHDLADLVVTVAGRWGQARTRVGFTGLPQAGKTTLINALCDREVLTGDLPEGIPVEVAAGPQSRVVAATPGGELVEFPTEAEVEVTAVRIEVEDVEPLGTFELVEMPGTDLVTVDGLTAIGRAAARCDMVVHVRSVDSPLARPEVEALAAIASTTDHIVVAFTRTDLIPGWQVNRDASVATLAEQIPEIEIETVALALPLVEVARRFQDTDPDLADDLESESGLPAIRSMLYDTAARKFDVRLANMLATCTAVLAEMEAICSPSRVGAPGNPDERLSFHSKALAQLRTDTSRWLTTISDEASRIRDRLSADLVAGVTEILSQVGDRLTRKELPPDTAGELLAALLSDLHARLVDATVEQFEKVVDDLEGDMGAPADQRRAPEPSSIATVGYSVEGGDGSGLSLRLSTSVAQLGSSAALAWWMLQAAAGPGGMLRGGFILLAGLLGGTTAVIGARQASAKATITETSAGLRRTADTWRAQELTELRSWVLATQRALEQAVREAVEERRRTHERAIADLRAGRTPDVYGLADRLAELRHRFTTLASRRESTL